VIDFAGINSHLLANAEGILQNWLPDGKRCGREWVARNPLRADNHAGSFSVNMQTGVWADFSTGDKGGDLISLRAFLDSCDQGEAARAIAAELNMKNPLRKHKRLSFVQPTPKKPVSANGKPFMAIPEDRPEPDLKHYKHGMPSATWEYHNERGQIVGHACRYESEGGKDVLPHSWQGTEWAWKAMPEPRPLYNLPRLLANPSAVVIVVEGEKTADAAQGIFPEAAVTTWAGGCKAWSKTDWLPLTGRRVIQWPDNDEGGCKAMEAIRAQLLGTIRVTSVKTITLPDWLPAKWDAADLLTDGWEREHVLQLLTDANRAIPDGLCPLCWSRNIAAPSNGPTCKHGDFTWPDWEPGHPNLIPFDGDADQWEQSRDFFSQRPTPEDHRQ
jgi:putative DNA primase/helicase